MFILTKTARILISKSNTDFVNTIGDDFQESSGIMGGKKRVCVIGSGVVGLTTAVKLLEECHTDVEVLLHMIISQTRHRIIVPSAIKHEMMIKMVIRR